MTKLSPRQAEVLSLLERGAMLKEIAAKLGISINTVKKHCGKLYRKVRADSARSCIHRARHLHGLLS